MAGPEGTTIRIDLRAALPVLALGFVILVWFFTALWTWTAIDPVPALMQYAVVIVLYPLLAPLLARVRARDPLNVPDESRGTARPGETTS